MFGGLFGSLGGGFYDQNFRAYPVAFIEKESAERGDKVILPPSSLNTLGKLVAHKRNHSHYIFIRR
jgi:hypothetical protein